MVAIGQQTAGPRPRADDEHTHTQEPEDNLVSDNHADEYTDIPPHNLPPGYVDNATEEDPPPAQSEPSTSSAPGPSSSNAPAHPGPSTSNAQAHSEPPRRGRAKRRLPTEPSSDNAGKRQRKK